MDSDGRFIKIMTEGEIREYIDTKGEKYTLLKLVEEMAELQKEILKYVNCREGDKDAIIEEVGDVQLHLMCAQIIFGITPAQVDVRMQYKAAKRRVKQ